jgi:hydrogenase maturation protein HypF
MLRTGAHSPPTSSVGRLFDAVASLVGLRQAAEFEGQAAMELEASADRATSRRYPVAIRDGELLVADPAPIVRAVVDDVRAGRSGAEVAGAFHATMAELIAELAARGRERTGVSRVALSGGVFQNALLTRRAEDALARRGLTALVHHQVPCNDGGLALGQVAVAVRLAAAAVERPAEVALCV